VTIDPSRSTVVAWYDRLPDDLDRLVARVHDTAAAALGGAFAPRDPAQVHATVIGLERAASPFDPGPLAAHLHAALARPLVVRFGFAPSDTRLRSRGRSLHERSFTAGPGPAVLVGWPVVDGVPDTRLADVRDGCAALGVTHRYGRDPDVHLVVGEVVGAPPGRVAGLEAAVRRALADRPVRVPLSLDDLSLVTYADTALPRASTRWRPLRPPVP
jgi:hypothetical protein